MTVWGAILSLDIIRSYFFEETEKGDNYLNMVHNYVPMDLLLWVK